MTVKLIADAMFISDLHLHPQQPEITNKFLAFCKWARWQTRKLYILGDFLHAWPGDDAIDSWSDVITEALKDLSSAGVIVYFMSGNRDFLIGKKFLNKAKVTELIEPAIINLGDNKVLLVHGDRYCTQDRSHQILRKFTRNRLFKLVFLSVPYRYRAKIVNKVRQYSANKSFKPAKSMLTVPAAVSRHLHTFKLNTVIHGHTHVPGLINHVGKYGELAQYVLSDWDANPMIMCYNKSNKFYYRLFVEEYL